MIFKLTIATGGEPTDLTVVADSTQQVLQWLANSDGMRTGIAANITIEHMDNVVDLLTQAGPKDARPAELDPGPAPAPDTPEGVASATSPEHQDVITIQQAMELTGLKRTDVNNRISRGRFMRAGYGRVTRASVQTWLDAGGRASERHAQDPGRVERMNAARAAKRAQRAQQPVAAPPAEAPDGNYVHEEKLAKELNMHLHLLQRIKRQGNVPGGNGWVHSEAFRAYMQSDEYRESL